MARPTIYYVVEGRWPFPLDMLRYDRSIPSTEADAALVKKLSGETMPVDLVDRRRYRVTLKRDDPPTFWPGPAEGRWNSFSWRVVG